jgi:hypothetical protein
MEAIYHSTEKYNLLASENVRTGNVLSPARCSVEVESIERQV